jgi:hypothetical protein
MRLQQKLLAPCNPISSGFGVSAGRPECERCAKQSLLPQPRSRCTDTVCHATAAVHAYSSLLCNADGQPRTKCVILAHLDTGMSYIPGFIVSFVLKVVCSPGCCS